MDNASHTQSGSSGEGSYIGKSVHLKGDLEADERLTISGQFEGNIGIPKQEVLIAKEARVKANVIKANKIKIEGQVHGNIDGIQRVELTSTANVVGKLTTREIKVHEGAVFKGQVDIITDSNQ